MAAFLMIQLSMFLLTISCVKATTFNYTRFDLNSEKIDYLGDALPVGGEIQITKNRFDASIGFSVGRAVYKEPIRLWDSNTGKVADITTHFTFQITVPDGQENNAGDGLAFFLAANASLPPFASGGALGLYNASVVFNSSENPAVAIEFDTYARPGNPWDPQGDHVGIDVNSINSTATWRVPSLKSGSTAYVWVSYNSSTQNLSAYMTYDQNFVFNGNSILSSVVDLKRILPEWVYVGFSASTGSSIELHNILTWEFNSTEFPSKGSNTKLIVGLVVSMSFLVLGVCFVLYLWWKKRKMVKDEEDFMLDEDYENGTGPKRFTYSELARATNNFTAEGKLGEGGFGGVYRGVFNDSNIEVAVKRISPKSKQGKKEFISEVKVISQLRHRNLVQLLGWCHERGELLLVYEFMPNASLDFHLFGGRTMITWVLRYKIALGLASALLYLHEEWEQAVVHRDIKSSNIMLDSGFSAKLGDFGLARLVDHDLHIKTTMIAGTMGYLAPECMVTGKAGKESDVYSFGVVILEIACGRRVVEHKEEESKVGLVAWVWELYGSGKLLEAADPKLSMDFDEQQLERLLVVGLWCANIDHTLRPYIKQAISVLNFESPLPDLPLKMSVPTHFGPSFHHHGFSYSSSSRATDTQGNISQASSSSYNTNSSLISTSASSSLLHSAPR
ncbi:non-specific serine/threonine protein kinase [Ranunculus cassubicifolius]